jgi:hypothetical protein
VSAGQAKRACCSTARWGGTDQAWELSLGGAGGMPAYATLPTAA